MYVDTEYSQTENGAYEAMWVKSALQIQKTRMNHKDKILNIEPFPINFSDIAH
ncbi:hypothetical protein VCR15J2_490016 [Vibrio coralliirubri]|nr:hypothetical protein VCR15J2_490016 [Vibrio coralliirubri]